MQAEYQTGSIAHVVDLANCLDGAVSIELGPTDAAVCAEALRFMAQYRTGENVFSMRRAKIRRALDMPAGAFERRDQLRAAIKLDGLKSPLVALAARRLAEAAETKAA